MRALARLAPAQGIAAMQSINVAAVTPLFMTALFGTAAACVFLAVWSLRHWQHQPGSVYLLPARRQPAVSGRHGSGNDPLQCAAQRRAGAGRTKQRG